VNPFERLRGRRNVDRDLADELGAHLDVRIEELVGAGLPLEDARQQARRELGNETLLIERGRDVWRFAMIEDAWQDVRYAWRQLVRAPGFTAVAVITFALGIGATTAIFTAVYAVVLQPFPFHEPDRVVAVGEQFVTGSLSAVSPGNFEDWRTHAKTFSDLGARRFVSVNVSSGTTPERLVGVAVTASYFSVFRIPAVLGRTITADENRAGRERVVVLSDRLWRRVFGGIPAVLGTTIRMDGHPYTVIGVMPPQFDRLGGPEEFWIPVVFTPEAIASHDGHSMYVVGRLAPGISTEQAAADLSIIFHRMKEQLPANTEVRQGIVNEFAAEVVGGSRERLLVLFGAVALVLLIACGNVAHLLLARGRLRSHEVALRASLGASRPRLIRQFLSESAVLAVAGGTLGVGAAYVAIPALLAIAPEAIGAIPRLDQTTVNGHVLLFALAAIVMSALLTGIVPALRASRLDLRTSLSDGARTLAGAKDTLRSGLVAGEVAVVIVLLAGAGVLIRSALYLQSVEPGFDGTSVLTARISLPEVGYEEPARVERAFRGLVERISQHPAVDVAAVSSSVPMTPGTNHNGLVPEGKAFDPSNFVLGRLGVITENYFRTFRIPLVAGRLFSVEDYREAPRVMILSRTAAQQLFPNENAVGQRVACCESGPDGAPLLKLVVGIVGDVRSNGPHAEPPADFYLPIQQAPAYTWSWFQRTLTVVVRGKTEGTGILTEALREAVRDIDPTVPVHGVATMQQRLQATLAENRFNLVLMLLLGSIGLLLSAVGIYGVIACFVAQRRHELAVRMALGASPADVVRTVVTHGMRPVWLGAVIGLTAAVALSQTLASSVYGVTPRDPVTLVAVVAVLIVVAILANLLPARAATRVNLAGLLAG